MASFAFPSRHAVPPAGGQGGITLGGLGLKTQTDLTPERNDVALVLDDPALAGLRIAVLSDLHIPEGPEAPARMAQLLETVNAAKPDLIALLEDYSSQELKLKD